MAGFFDKVPPNGVFVPVTLSQFQADLIRYSDQTSMAGWQARDSYIKFVDFTIDKYAKRGITLTQDQLILNYYSDPTIQLAIIASNVPLNTQAQKQPRYARMSYTLDSLSGMIVGFSVHQFIRWPFFNALQQTNPGPNSANLTTE